MTDTNVDTLNDWYSAERATFGDRVAGAREAMNMPQSELSKRIGVKLTAGAEDDDDSGE